MTTLRAMTALATVALVGAGAGTARADLFGYASAVGGNLYSVDLTTGKATLIGNDGINMVEGLALRADGTLFATDDSGTLYTLSTTTGAVTKTIGSTGLGDVEGLAFAGSTLVATNFSNTTTSLYSLNTATANPTLIANTNPNVIYAVALTASSATTGFLLATVISGLSVSQSLYTVNSSGATTLLGQINPSSGVSGALAYSDGTLYSLDSAGNEYTVSKTNGQYTLVGNTGNSAFYLDLTVAPASAAVPEPSTFALAGLGLLPLALRAWRKRSRG